jgi:hypothetical protein
MKKLWHLQPVDEAAAPWLSFHNCMFGFVVRAFAPLVTIDIDPGRSAQILSARQQRLTD